MGDNKLPKILAVDFDGTITKTNCYPECGLPNEDVVRVVKILRVLGWKVILFTCRSGDELKVALDFCDGLGLRFDAVNDNIPEVKELWGCHNLSPKPFANYYLDDLAVNKDYLWQWLRQIGVIR